MWRRLQAAVAAGAAVVECEKVWEEAFSGYNCLPRSLWYALPFAVAADGLTVRSCYSDTPVDSLAKAAASPKTRNVRNI